MTPRLPSRPAQYFIDEIILQSPADGGWTPSGAQGYDLQAGPREEGFLPVATSLSDVGASYPSLVITPSQPGSTGGETTYDFLTNKGPGQNRTGSLLATARAEDHEDGYTGDSSTHSAVSAADVVDELINEVEDVCLRNPQGADSMFSFLGSQRPADMPDDFDVTPSVRMAQAEIRFGWTRRP